jgi:hypothetical protein
VGVLTGIQRAICLKPQRRAATRLGLFVYAAARPETRVRGWSNSLSFIDDGCVDKVSMNLDGRKACHPLVISWGSTPASSFSSTCNAASSLRRKRANFGRNRVQTKADPTPGFGNRMAVPTVILPLINRGIGHALELFRLFNSIGRGCKNRFHKIGLVLGHLGLHVQRNLRVLRPLISFCLCCAVINDWVWRVGKLIRTSLYEAC